ncbi:hypothetical protein HDV00_000321 [Rhizophlyctis rosea]|nr:hypothetical protein HDV00_000321 [Rhizophlyctis rosea]
MKAGLIFTALFGAAVTTVAGVRVMPFGDSITGSTTQFPGCWRALLWQRLQQEGRTANLDFVGSGKTDASQCYSITYDGDNEGHAGFRATDIANNNQLVGWLATNPADIILMHLGTNDIFANIATNTITTAFTTLLSQMRAANPATKLIIAQIIPSTAGSSSAYNALNSQIPQWAAQHTTTQSPIVVVDQWTGFDATADLKDGVHPNRSGDQKMADRWYPALIAALGTTTTTTTTTRTTTTTTNPGQCTGGVTTVVAADRTVTVTANPTTVTVTRSGSGATSTSNPGTNCAAKYGQCGGQGEEGNDGRSRRPSLHQ